MTLLYGFLLTLGLYFLGTLLSHFLKGAIFNAFFLSSVLGVIIFKFFNLSWEEYAETAQFLNFFLDPITIMFAVPLYQHRKLILKHWILFLTNCLLAGSFSFSLIWVSNFFIDLDPNLLLSSYSKGITTPIAIQLTEALGGMVPFSVLLVIISAITGACLGRFIISIFRIKSSFAIGASLGAVSHVVGTSLAFEIGEEEGALSSAAISITGIISLIIIPLLLGT